MHCGIRNAHKGAESMRALLAVDGGQTSTRVIVARDDGFILAQSTGGPSNHTEEPGGAARFEQVISSTISRALKIAGLPALSQAQFQAACFGMTGETTIKQAILSRIIRTPRLLVVHDSANALMGATAGEPGLIVLAGTGSVARAMDRQGREFRVGGWGHLFGDEGSAYWIGREAVRAIARQIEGYGEKTDLTPHILDRLGVTSAAQVMTKYYTGEWPRDHLASLAPWVDEAARRGDEIAQAILEKAGGELAKQAFAVLYLLRRESASYSVQEPEEDPLVSYTGGVFESQFVLSSFIQSVRREHPRIRIEAPLFSPVFGSLLLAGRSAQTEFSPSIRSQWRTASIASSSQQ
jgi:N-acetylglucosamine kinase-like BadF-type ATPase